MINSEYKFETLVWQVIEEPTPELALSKVEGKRRGNIES